MLQFNEKRTTQAAAALLKKANGKLNYMVLIKFLYLADRKALLDFGSPITGDDYYSMKLGPILSETLDLITDDVPLEDQNKSFWRTHIERQGNAVILKDDPGDDELSEADEGLISEVFSTYYAKYQEFRFDQFKFCDYLHTILPEYKQVDKGRKPLDYHDILMAGKKTIPEMMETESMLKSIGWMQHLRTR